MTATPLRSRGSRSARKRTARAILTAGFTLATIATGSGARADPAGPLSFERFGPRQGLPAEMIVTLRRDRAGFLWIGSREGLVLFDGYSFTLFDHDVNDPGSLSDNAVRTIQEDRAGNLWIGTNTGGLNRLDRARRRFERFRHDASNPRSLSHDSVYTVLEDRDGALWVGTQKGLNRFDPARHDFERLMADRSDDRTPGGDFVLSLLEDREGALWVGTLGAGLQRRDPATGRFARFRHDPADLTTISHDDVFSLAEAPDGTLWVGTRTGVDYRRPGDARFRRVGGPDECIPGLLSPVAALAAGDGGAIWAGTIGGGLIEIDGDSGMCRPHPPVADPERELGDDRVQALLSDPTGDLWVGTYTGLRRLRIESRLFSGIERAEVPGRTIAPLTVNGALEDRKGRLWLADFGSGLLRRDPGGDRFRQYAASTGRSTIGDGLIRITSDRAGRIWVGGTVGLYCLDPETEEVHFFRHVPGRIDGLGPGYVAAVFSDREGRIWAGTGEGGLHRLRADGRTFDVFRPDPNNPASLSDEYVTVILEDHAGTLWVGTRSGGLNALDRASGRFRRYQPVAGDVRSLSHHYVTSLLEDSSGRLWVGTGGGGLDLAERDPNGGTVSFIRITQKDGLIDDNVMALAEDDDRSLWIATRRGLSRYDPERKIFVNYGATDLPTSVQFNSSGAARGARHIYFGSTRGALVADLGTPFPEVSASPTLITSIRSPAGPLTGDRPAWDVDRIAFPYGDVISFDFAVLDFEGREHHRYAYLLDANPKGWTDIGSQRSVTFTGLVPGTHTLTLRGRNARGVWSDASAVVIDVVPPFWMTSWFRGLVAFGVLGLAIGVHGFRVASLERRNRELTAIKVQREAALNEARLKEDQLRGAYAELRTLTRRLEDAKEEERRRIARELHDEMGQSLTAAKINLRILERPQTPEAGQQRIEDTIGLVDRMIGHVRALSLDLRPPMLDELGLSAALRGYLEAVARRSGIQIDVFEQTPIPAALPPEIAITLFRGVQEAVTNVVRHAGAASVTVRMRHDDGMLAIDVRDDGRGFSVPDTLDRAIRGAHLGLLGLMERVRGMGGEIVIDSSPDRGTELKIQVPYRG